MKVRDVAIVGAGMSGLVAAAHLAAYGLDVVVIEKSSAAGGKLEPVRIGEAMLDAGPTVLTLRRVLDEVLAEIGVTTDDYLTLRPLDVLARHAWQESEWLDLYADRQRSADAIGKFSGAASARAYLEFCRDSAGLYGILEASFIRSAEPSLWNLVRGVGSLRDLMRIKPFKTLWSELGRYFLDPRLRQLFARYATYCGSSPFEAPATLMLIAHVEQAGVWRVEGGMHRIGSALAEVARLKGADVRFASAVASIECHNGAVAGVRLSSGERIAARCVLSTADAAAIRGGLLGGAPGSGTPCGCRTTVLISADMDDAGNGERPRSFASQRVLQLRLRAGVRGYRWRMAACSSNGLCVCAGSFGADRGRA